MFDNQIEEVPFLSNVGFMLTYKCTVACPHCIVKAGPHRKEEMTLESAFKWLKELKQYRNGFILGISFTGGEVFYNLENLIKTADYANQLGFIVSAVSNAYWANTKEKALEVLNGCSSIHMISVSTDIPHLKHIPLSNIKNAIWAAKKTRKLYNIAVTTENDESSEYQKLMDDILEITDPEYINTSYVLPVGRANRKTVTEKYRYTSEPSQAACSMASFPVIFPNGNISACIGPPITLPEYNPLHLGNLNKESIKEIFDKAEHNYVLHAVRTFGPKALIDLLIENGFHNLLPKRYIKDALCDICRILFSNEETCKILDDLIREDDYFRKRTEYGRVYYLNETEMIKEYNV